MTPSLSQELRIKFDSLSHFSGLSVLFPLSLSPLTITVTFSLYPQGAVDQGVRARVRLAGRGRQEPRQDGQDRGRDEERAGGPPRLLGRGEPRIHRRDEGARHRGGMSESQAQRTYYAHRQGRGIGEKVDCCACVRVTRMAHAKPPE